MYAIIETGGKQYTVREGDMVRIEKIGLTAGEKIVFDRVLLLSADDGVKIGDPLVKGAFVEANVISEGKEKKITIFKIKAKKGYRKTQGHRQPFTKVQISGIIG